MISSLRDYRTENALPAEMRTAERKALSRAFDRQKKKFIDRIERVSIWSNIENVEEDKLDFLAVENRVLFYNSNLEPDVKRNLIKNSIYWYMKLGTRQAMEEMINIVFGNENTSIEEWYTYAGEPFHFQIAVGTTVTQISIREFLQYLNTIKNARSRFDYLVFQNGITLKFSSRSEYQKFVYTFCGESECGTYPETSIGLEVEEINITLEGESEEGFTAYTQAGTTPDISVGAVMPENIVTFQDNSETGSAFYERAGDMESGTAPDISIGAQFTEVQVGLEGASEESIIVYPSDSDAESGSFPDQAIGLSEGESGVSTSPEGDGFNLYYNTAEKYAAEE